MYSDFDGDMSCAAGVVCEGRLGMERERRPVGVCGGMSLPVAVADDAVVLSIEMSSCDCG